MKIGVILSGCGMKDGSEIHEATLTLLFLDRAGAQTLCFAPDKPQTKVVNHITRSPSSEKRSVLAESARIARGDIRPLTEAKVDDLDGAILPGGFGAVLNLCTFGEEGASCSVDSDLERLLRALHSQGKPIGAICIAPAILAKVFGGESPRLTIGTDAETAKALEAMGAKHREAEVGDIVVDERLRIVTTPAYMLASRISETASGIEHLVAKVLEMAKSTSKAAVDS